MACFISQGDKRISLNVSYSASYCFNSNFYAKANGTVNFHKNTLNLYPSSYLHRHYRNEKERC